MRTRKGLPTGSRLQLAMACAASQVLDQVDTEFSAGEAGREKHAALGEEAAGHPLAPESVTPETWAWLERMREEERYMAPIRGAAREPAYAFDVNSGAVRFIGLNVGWQYNASPSEIAGAMDFVKFEEEADTVTVIDLKTGQGETPHPRRNHQLRFGGMTAAAIAGASNARLGLLIAPEGRAPYMQWHTLEPYDIQEVRLELKKLADRVGWAREAVAKGKVPHLTVGDHCNNCKARHGCPARVAMAKRITGEPEQVVMDLKAMLTPELASKALARWRAASGALKEVGAALYAYAKENPIAQGDGEVWGPITKEREEIDAEKAWFILEKAFGTDIAKAAMTFETSKAGINRAMKEMREQLRGWPVEKPRPPGVVDAPKGPRGTTIKGLEEHALKLLRDGNAVEKKPHTEYDTYPATPPRLAE